MKYVLGFLLLALSQVSAVAGDGVQTLFKEYQKVQTALAADDLANAKTAATAFHKELKQVQKAELPGSVQKIWTEQEPNLRVGAMKMTKVEQIDAFRLAFEEISRAMIALYETAHPEGLHRYRCPMAFENRGAEWLQKEDDKAWNPYFGAAMLHCGGKVKASDHSGHGHEGHDHD